MIDFVSKIDEIFDMQDQVEIDQLLLQSVKSMAKAGEFYSAYGLAKFIQAGCEAAESLIVIAEDMIAINANEDASLLLKKASVFLLKDTELWQQAELLCRIANSFHKVTLKEDAICYFKKAIDCAENGQLSQCQQTSVDSSSVLSEIAVSIASMGEVDWALEVAAEVRFSGRKENTLLEIRPLQKK